MSQRGYQVLDRGSFDAAETARLEFADHVLVGLAERPKRLSSRFFYDDEGSRLFRAITELDEYYPTRCEWEILEAHDRELLERYRGQELNLVDLGAGDGRKTAVLLRRALELGLDVTYVPIDISEASMVHLLEVMGARLPELRIAGLVGEYGDGLRWLGSRSDGHNLVLFLGSNIGNFDRPSARGFLRRLWSAMNPGDHLLVGFDLKKDIELLLAAYNDREGVTAAFNLNLLARINRELGGDFDMDKFRHFATYDVFTGAMASYLVSLEAQRVKVAAVGATFEFRPWEPIHTEYSYKYLDSDIDALCGHAGFVDEARFYDSRGWFCNALWRVER